MRGSLDDLCGCGKTDARGNSATADGSSMRFRLLGPLRVVDADQPVPLGGTNQRAALGYLLLYPNQVVATSRLLHALWRDDAPPTARKILQNAISNLRRALGRSPDDTSVM